MNNSSNGLNAKFDRGNKLIEVTLDLLYWEEDNVCFFYSPALDLTGYGYSEQEARKSFEITLKEFVTYTDNKKTIYAELERLGWTINKRKKRINPPNEADLIEDNETYKELLSRPGIVLNHTNFDLALV